MPSRENKDLAHLDDIREACSIIIARIRYKKLPDFVENLELQDGIAMRLAVIGESAKNLSEKTKRQYPNVMWKDITGLRNIIVHNYGRVEALKIWKIIQDDVPQLLDILS